MIDLEIFNLGELGLCLRYFTIFEYSEMNTIMRTLSTIIRTLNEQNYETIENSE